MQKYATRQLREDINKFVEEQTHIPFTMRNIYKMLELVVGTTGQRMDKAIEVVFDKVTMHHHENKFGIQGWKTNENYVLTQKFIIPNICWQDQRWYKGENNIRVESSKSEILEDMLKGICYITGDNYDTFATFERTAENKYLAFADGKYVTASKEYSSFDYERKKAEKEGKTFEVLQHNPEYGKWFDWAYFRVKCFKVGTAHLEFKDKEIWARFNQRIAQIKGFPLYEKAPDKRTERQKAKSETKPSQNQNRSTEKVKPTILGTFKLNFEHAE